jgi:hypothetical protein
VDARARAWLRIRSAGPNEAEHPFRERCRRLSEPPESRDAHSLVGDAPWHDIWEDQRRVDHKPKSSRVVRVRSVVTEEPICEKAVSPAGCCSPLPWSRWSQNPAGNEGNAARRNNGVRYACSRRQCVVKGRDASERDIRGDDSKRDIVAAEVSERSLRAVTSREQQDPCNVTDEAPKRRVGGFSFQERREDPRVDLGRPRSISKRGAASSWWAKPNRWCSEFPYEHGSRHGHVAQTCCNKQRQDMSKNINDGASVETNRERESGKRPGADTRDSFEPARSKETERGRMPHTTDATARENQLWQAPSFTPEPVSTGRDNCDGHRDQSRHEHSNDEPESEDACILTGRSLRRDPQPRRFGPPPRENILVHLVSGFVMREVSAVVMSASRCPSSRAIPFAQPRTWLLLRAP